MDITPATTDDIPQLCDLLAILFEQEAEFEAKRAAQADGLGQIIDFPDRGRILVLRDGETAVGMVSLLFTVSTALGARVALLEDMIVRPDYRRGGAGSHLMRAAIDLAAQAGCRRITLLTDRTNEAARRFYARHGFTASAMASMRLQL